MSSWRINNKFINNKKSIDNVITTKIIKYNQIKLFIDYFVIS